jgi:hypothetical protein
VGFFQALLHPYYLGSHGDGFLHNPGYGLHFAEDIHDLHRERDIPKTGVTFFPQNLLAARVDWNNAVTMFLEIVGYLMAGFAGISRQSHYSHHPVIIQDFGNLRNAGLNL